MIKIKKVKNLFFYTPPMQNHYFWGPMEAEMARQSGLETIFWAIDIDECIRMRVQEAWDAAGGAAPLPALKCGARASTKRSESNSAR